MRIRPSERVVTPWRGALVPVVELWVGNVLFVGTRTAVFEVAGLALMVAALVQLLRNRNRGAIQRASDDHST